PADAVDASVHVGAGRTPGLPDLPDQQQRKQVAVLGELVEGGAHLGLALDERNAAPRLVLRGGGSYGLLGGRPGEHRWSRDTAAVDGRARRARLAVAMPASVPQVADPVLVERLWGDLTGTGVRFSP